MKWSACHERGTKKKKIWDPDRIRTYDLPNTGRALYPLERGHILGSYAYANHSKSKTSRTNNIRARSVIVLATVAMGVYATAYDGSLRN